MRPLPLFAMNWDYSWVHICKSQQHKTSQTTHTHIQFVTLSVTYMSHESSSFFLVVWGGERETDRKKANSSSHTNTQLILSAHLVLMRGYSIFEFNICCEIWTVNVYLCLCVFTSFVLIYPNKIKYDVAFNNSNWCHEKQKLSSNYRHLANNTIRCVY